VKEWMGCVEVSTEGHERMMVVYHWWWRVQAVGGGEQGAVGTGEEETCTMAGE